MLQVISATPDGQPILGPHESLLYSLDDVALSYNREPQGFGVLFLTNSRLLWIPRDFMDKDGVHIRAVQVFMTSVICTGALSDSFYLQCYDTSREDKQTIDLLLSMKEHQVQEMYQHVSTVLGSIAAEDEESDSDFIDFGSESEGTQTE
ncbi:hypothetical protein RCL1_001437 [Eukaryota sp. TZLM3-RCL]